MVPTYSWFIKMTWQGDSKGRTLICRAFPFPLEVLWIQLDLKNFQESVGGQFKTWWGQHYDFLEWPKKVAALMLQYSFFWPGLAAFSIHFVPHQHPRRQEISHEVLGTNPSIYPKKNTYWTRTLIQTWSNLWTNLIK